LGRDWNGLEGTGRREGEPHLMNSFLEAESF